MTSSSLRSAVITVASAGLLVLVAGVTGEGQRGPLTATTFPTTLVTGTLKDSTRYTLAKPEAWNGTVFVDLDSLGMNADYSNWLYAHGIARVGTSRDQVGSLMDRAAANMIEALDIFSTRFGKPTRAIIWGNSLGGQAAAVAAFRYPDRFAAALPHCGGLMGWSAYLNTNFDVAFVLKTLIDPNAALPLVHMPDDDMALNAKWTALIEGAQKTPQGRARIALAAAVGQAPVWTVASQPEPAANDAVAREEATYRTVLDFSRQFTGLRRRLEGPAGGATSWNAGVNYAELYEKADSTDRLTVDALYRQAGLSLKDDLAALAKAPRVAAEAGPLEYVHQMYPFDGRISMPVMGMNSTGDPYVWSAVDSGYLAAVRRAGREDLLRLTYVHSAGHCAFSGAERVATFQVILERLDTGRWPDTSAAALNARAAAVNFGAQRFWDHKPNTLQRASQKP